MSHWNCPPGRKALRPIPADKLPEMVGERIHMAWASNECHFTLEKIDGSLLIVSTGHGRNKRMLSSQASDARYLRRVEPRKEQ